VKDEATREKSFIGFGENSNLLHGIGAIKACWGQASDDRPIRISFRVSLSVAFPVLGGLPDALTGPTVVIFGDNR